MNRRSFVRLAAGTSACPLLTGCKVFQYLAPHYVSVDMSQLIQAAVVQDCPEWCWAASISMIFGFYGHHIRQEDIVAQAYGSLVCASGSPNAIYHALNRSWIDSTGKKFTSVVTSTFDAYDKIYSLTTNSAIINELTTNHPLLYCNTTHAEVLFSMTYNGTPEEPNVIEANVVDPWPTNPRLHPLSVPELVPADRGGQLTILATVRVN